MATLRTILTGLVQSPTSPAADATGDYVVPADNRQDLLILVSNGSGASINVILDDVNSVDPGSSTQFNPDVTIAVPAGAKRAIAISDSSRFLNTSNGRISWTYSSATSVTVDVFGI